MARKPGSDKEALLDTIFGGKGQYRAFVYDQMARGIGESVIVRLTETHVAFSRATLRLWLQRWEKEACTESK